jgi:ABC-type branched-subunit amino acid transport system ATPase component
LKSLDSAITLILIEHDMAVALAVADEVIVMHDGEVFTKGTPEEIRKSSAVRDLYLGSNHE